MHGIAHQVTQRIGSAVARRGIRSFIGSSRLFILLENGFAFVGYFFLGWNIPDFFLFFGLESIITLSVGLLKIHLLPTSSEQRLVQRLVRREKTMVGLFGVALIFIAVGASQRDLAATLLALGTMLAPLLILGFFDTLSWYRRTRTLRDINETLYQISVMMARRALVLFFFGFTLIGVTLNHATIVSLPIVVACLLLKTVFEGGRIVTSRKRVL